MSRTRTKGTRFENLVVELLREAGADVRRGRQDKVNSADEPDVEGFERYWVECKHHRRVDIREAVRQAERGIARTGSRRLPVVIFRDNRGPVYFVVPASEALRWRKRHGAAFVFVAKTKAVHVDHRKAFDLAMSAGGQYPHVIAVGRDRDGMSLAIGRIETLLELRPWQ